MNTINFGIETFDSEAMCGYKQITTFYTDFSIAERFGIEAIQDTYDRAFKEWHDDYKFITELAMVLNWKSWRWVEANEMYSKLYVDLFYQCQDWCYENLKGDELTYYVRTTD